MVTLADDVKAIIPSVAAPAAKAVIMKGTAGINLSP